MSIRHHMLECIVDSDIGPESIIRSHTVIYADCKLGARLQTGHGVLIRENNCIGDDVSIGSHTVLEPGNRIRNNVRIHSNCFLSNVLLEHDVWIGPNVVFTDDPHPPCPRYLECGGGAWVAHGAKIGANCTILPGVLIGTGAIVGAGSVVTKAVREGTVVAGNPAKMIGYVEELECRKGYFTRPYEWEEDDGS